MKLRKSSYRYTYSSFNCYPHNQQHNNYRYNLSLPSHRIKSRVLHTFDRDIGYVMHIYDTLQLTVFTDWTLYEWILHAL